MLFSEWQRALLLSFHRQSVVRLHWTAEILDECFRNLKRLGRLNDAGCQFHAGVLSSECPQALCLPAPAYLADVKAVDDKDRHVAAAALSLRHQLSQSEVVPVILLTWNIKDFPKKPLHRLHIVRSTPDEWLTVWMTHHSLADSMSVLGDAARYMQAWRERLGDSLTVYQQRSPFVPEKPDAWPEFLHRNWFKQAAKVLAAQLSGEPSVGA